jgi:serine/threonine protein kinase
MIGSTLAGLLITLAAIAAAVLALVFIAVPVFKGVGSLVGGAFKSIGWLISHIFEFVFGLVTDIARCLGAIPALLVFSFLSLVNVVIGRWSAAGHFGEAVIKECRVGAGCLYRAVLRRPLKLVWLHGLLEGLEQRVPQVWEATPHADLPGKGTGQFAGYTIVGSLRAGGSGAKLYVAKPEEKKRESLAGKPDVVVIKSFALTDGSSLPQIIRESRALESAKLMGHVLDHGLDEHRFHYVMPYIAGDNLGMVTRQLHGESETAGLTPPALSRVMTYTEDLLQTLDDFHRHGLWHKDVKPENVIVHDGHAHVVDLGLLTPLQSAMTLTTHGTEYFRDPEMVRQALRGVKVHQIDGAKFDIYGAGAVLYFMLENTFPAHGGLSAFSRRAPESLRWIVKRSMADYSKRYESAAEMLDDLRYVRSSHDPFAVRPADLPSMRHDSPERPAHQSTFGFTGIGPGIDGNRPFTFAGHLNPDPADRPAPMTPASAMKRPSLQVTNWWTGEYAFDRVEVTGGSRSAAALAAARARRPAVEQVRTARERAKELTLQARARIQQQLARRHSRTPKVLWVLALVAIAVPAFFVANLTQRVRSATSVSSPIVMAPMASQPRNVLVVTDGRMTSSNSAARVGSAVSQAFGQGAIPIYDTESVSLTTRLVEYARRGDSVAIAQLDKLAAERGCVGLIAWPSDRNVYVHRASQPASPALKMPDAGRVLLVNAHPALTASSVMRKIDEEIASLQAQGMAVESGDADAAAAFTLLLPRWQQNRASFDEDLEDLLEKYGYYGALWVHAHEGTGSGDDRVESTFIRSTRAGAETRKAQVTEISAADIPSPPSTSPTTQP